MIISLIIAIPVTALVTGFLCIKCLHLGLRWSIETKESKLPTMDSPIKPIIDNMERKEEKKQVELSQNVFDEWVNGAKEG